MNLFRKNHISIFLLVPILLSCRPLDRKPATGDRQGIQGEIIIFHAGSLSVPFKKIAQEFETVNPGIKVLLEPAGSVACARKITDLKKPCDLMASSDYKVIEELLIPGYTGWHIPFASNELVIAYNENSTGSQEINDSNWPEILLSKNVFYGRADPNSDPCGYRTVMTFQLASQLYLLPELESKLTDKDQKYIRPKEVDLLALLEVGEIDYIFIYKSVAVQHQLKFTELPEEINLGNPALDEQYRKAIVAINSSEPGKSMQMSGEAMIYSITMPDNAPNRTVALAFLAFLLDKEHGMKIMEQEGQKSVVPAPNKFYSRLPEPLKKFAEPIDN